MNVIGRKRSRSTCDNLYDESLVALDMELHRSRVAYGMSRQLHEACQSCGIDSMSLFVGFVFETIAARCAYEQQNGTSGVRKWLHPHLDPGKGLLIQRIGTTEANEISRGTLDSIKYDAGGILAVVSRDGDVVEVPIKEWEACEPIPLHLDPMLPCGEVVEPHRSPQSVYQLCLSKLCEADKVTKSKSYNAKKRQAWEIADKATALAFAARHQLHDPANPPKATQRSISVTFSKDDTSGEIEATVSLEGQERDVFPFETTHKLVAWQYYKLRRFYCIQNDCDDSCLTSDPNTLRVFHLRLFTMLQRYTGVTGLFSRIEAGWHAAVPPEPFDFLRTVMGAEAEGFASPLNARMHRFCSAFADTDCHFGSFGPFHQFFPRRGCFEVGPPYDHEVIRIAFDHAIECLDSPLCDGPLCFVFIIPESQRDSGLKVREAVERSKYQRVSEVIAKADAKYIDGFQHRPGENRLIVISCDTRIIILQNDASAAILPAHENFRQLKDRWVKCTSVIDRGQDEERAQSFIQL